MSRKLEAGISISQNSIIIIYNIYFLPTGYSWGPVVGRSLDFRNTVVGNWCPVTNYSVEHE